MSSSTSSSPIQSRPHQPHILTTCSNSSCRTQLEFPVPTSPSIPRQGTTLNVQCFKCKAVFTHVFYPGQVLGGGLQSVEGKSGASGSNGGGGGGSSSGMGVRKGGRKIGTQERPLEMEYYDLLGVPVDATTDDIKKAYRRLAIKHHPDKNPDDPNAEEKFKEIAIAYQTLSDPDLRRKYNEFGSKESQPEGGFVDPEEVFGAMFGGDRFVPIIGHISLAKDMKAAMQEAEDEEGQGSAVVQRDAKGKEILSPEEKARREEKARKVSAEKAAAREKRVQELVSNLERKLGIFTESATGPDDKDVTTSWRTICSLEAEELKSESYGVELLQTIGFVYASKAKHFLATAQTFLGVGGWLHNVQGKYHVFSETVSTLRSAIELKAVFDQIQAAEQNGNMSPEERKRLEDSAAEKGIQALFKGTKLEVESVLRETCDRVLGDPNITREKAQLRAIALQILGQAYMTVQKEQDEAKEESEYVRVETKGSRDRQSQRASTGGSGWPGSKS
ncbi:DnaJ-domain-containing protein [Stereum hirsutum FP-91666 SS1]|uniref:DnaJ-domain-containing protein n=1 Tax=Stereum hirsutum (strain FP-91666) TaxID=721885 RepID=UPI000444A8F9|nr:DnaJ-domain-containing protein [Stereum hirsutum FP-91666 SS1]EIM80660.1 DnaJ-domain-containing protein [Stereum hirsutum FP-91666 SS1]